APEEAAAHHVVLARDGVQHLDRIAIRIERELGRRVDEAEGDDLLIIAVREAPSQARHRSCLLALGQHALRVSDAPYRYVVVTVEPRRFLDEILLDGEIEAKGRGRDDKVGGFADRIEPK